MNTILAYVAGFCCSLCYGGSTVLQQDGARRQGSIDSLEIKHAYNLFKQAPYTIGIVLDIFGWLFFLYSARQLPLFLCLAFVSFTLVTTAVLALIFKGIKVSDKEKLSLALIFIGLLILVAIAKPSEARSSGHLFNICLALGAIPIAMLGVKFLNDKKIKYGTLALAALAGLAYGATGIISRIIHFHHINFSNMFQLLVLAIIVYGILGLFFLAAALQRENVNKVNSVMYSFELVVPSIVGIVFLGDKVVNNNWLVLVVGLLLVSVGSIIIAFEKDPLKANIR